MNLILININVIITVFFFIGYLQHKPNLGVFETSLYFVFCFLCQGVNVTFDSIEYVLQHFTIIILNVDSLNVL